MPFKNWTPAGKRIGPVRSYGDEQEGEEWAPFVIPAKAPTPAAPAAPPKPAFVPPVADMTAAPPVNELKPPPVVAPGFVGASSEQARAASEKRQVQSDPKAKPVDAPSLQEQEVTAPTVDVARGTEKAPPPTETQVAAGVAPAPPPVAPSAPMEDWGIPAGAIEQPKLFDFSHVGGPKPSNFVSFGELASTLDDAWRQGLESDAQAAAKAREDARRAFSRALQQANEQQVDVQSAPAYAEFLRAQSYAEDVIGGGLGSQRNAGDSVGEEALRGVYGAQMEPLAKQIREQRQQAEKFASQRNEQRAKAKASQEALPVSEPRKAPPPPRADQRGAQPRELTAADREAIKGIAMTLSAPGMEPDAATLAYAEQLYLSGMKQGENAQRNTEAINRAMPGKL